MFDSKLMMSLLPDDVKKAISDLETALPALASDLQKLIVIGERVEALLTKVESQLDKPEA